MKVSKKDKDKKGPKIMPEPNLTISIKKKQNIKTQGVRSPQTHPVRRLSIKEVNKNKHMKEHKDKRTVKLQKETKDMKLTQYLRQKYLSPQRVDEENIAFAANMEQPIQLRARQCITEEKEKSRNGLGETTRLKKLSRFPDKIKIPEEVNKEYNIKNKGSPLLKYKHRTRKIESEEAESIKKADSQNHLQTFLNQQTNLTRNKSIKQDKNSTLRMLNSGKLSPTQNKFQQHSNNNATPSKPIRFSKFAFRSEKYIRLSSELKLEQAEKYSQQQIQDTQTDPYESPNNASPFRTSPGVNPNYLSLQKEIKYYKDMINRSENVLLIMNEIFEDQRKKLTDKKKQYRDQINQLKDKISENRLKNNLGHIFSYKDFDVAKLVPSDIIVERMDRDDEENIEDFEALREKGEMIINYYEHLQEQKNNFEDDILSINSRE